MKKSKCLQIADLGTICLCLILSILSLIEASAFSVEQAKDPQTIQAVQGNWVGGFMHEGNWVRLKISFESKPGGIDGTANIASQVSTTVRIVHSRDSGKPTIATRFL